MKKNCYLILISLIINKDIVYLYSKNYLFISLPMFLLSCSSFSYWFMSSYYIVNGKLLSFVNVANTVSWTVTGYLILIMLSFAFWKWITFLSSNLSISSLPSSWVQIKGRNGLAFPRARDTGGAVPLTGTCTRSKADRPATATEGPARVLGSTDLGLNSGLKLHIWHLSKPLCTLSLCFCFVSIVFFVKYIPIHAHPGGPIKWANSWHAQHSA